MGTPPPAAYECASVRVAQLLVHLHQLSFFTFLLDQFIGHPIPIPPAPSIPVPGGLLHNQHNTFTYQFTHTACDALDLISCRLSTVSSIPQQTSSILFFAKIWGFRLAKRGLLAILGAVLLPIRVLASPFHFTMEQPQKQKLQLPFLVFSAADTGKNLDILRADSQIVLLYNLEHAVTLMPPKPAPAPTPTPKEKCYISESESESESVSESKSESDQDNHQEDPLWGSPPTPPNTPPPGAINKALPPQPQPQPQYRQQRHRHRQRQRQRKQHAHHHPHPTRQQPPSPQEAQGWKPSGAGMDPTRVWIHAAYNDWTMHTFDMAFTRCSREIFHKAHIARPKLNLLRNSHPNQWAAVCIDVPEHAWVMNFAIQIQLTEGQAHSAQEPPRGVPVVWDNNHGRDYIVRLAPSVENLQGMKDREYQIQLHQAVQQAKAKFHNLVQKVHGVQTGIIYPTPKQNNLIHVSLVQHEPHQSKINDFHTTTSATTTTTTTATATTTTTSTTTATATTNSQPSHTGTFVDIALNLSAIQNINHRHSQFHLHYAFDAWSEKVVSLPLKEVLKPTPSTPPRTPPQTSPQMQNMTVRERLEQPREHKHNINSRLQNGNQGERQEQLQQIESSSLSGNVIQGQQMDGPKGELLIQREPTSGSSSPKDELLQIEQASCPSCPTSPISISMKDNSDPLADPINSSKSDQSCPTSGRRSNFTHIDPLDFNLTVSPLSPETPHQTQYLFTHNDRRNVDEKQNQVQYQDVQDNTDPSFSSFSLNKSSIQNRSTENTIESSTISSINNKRNGDEPGESPKSSDAPPNIPATIDLGTTKSNSERECLVSEHIQTTVEHTDQNVSTRCCTCTCPAQSSELGHLSLTALDQCRVSKALSASSHRICNSDSVNHNHSPHHLHLPTCPQYKETKSEQHWVGTRVEILPHFVTLDFVLSTESSPGNPFAFYLNNDGCDFHVLLRDVSSADDQKKQQDLWISRALNDRILPELERTQKLQQEKAAERGFDLYKDAYKEIIFMRHATYKALPSWDERCLDPVLDPVYSPGEIEYSIRLLSETNFGHRAQIIYTSPAKRCIMTAAYFARKWNLPVRVEWGLQEWNWDGTNRAESLATLHEQYCKDIDLTYTSMWSDVPRNETAGHRLYRGRRLGNVFHAMEENIIIISHGSLLAPLMEGASQYYDMDHNQFSPAGVTVYKKAKGIFEIFNRGSPCR